jgi:hypothetical protein
MPITNYTDIILQSQIITCEFKHRQWEEFEDTKGVIRIRKSKKFVNSNCSEVNEHTSLAIYTNEKLRNKASVIQLKRERLETL